MAAGMHIRVPRYFMTFCQRITSSIALSLMGGLGMLALAQQPSAQQPQRDAERQRTDANMITGCLNKGAGADQYVLTDSTGTKTPVTASEDVGLAKHAANHTVKLTGSKGSDGTFTATKVEHVSPNCATK